MKVLKIVAIIVVVLVLLLVGALFYVNHYVQTPAFKQQVLDAARQATGTEVKINEMKVSLFSGIGLQGVTVANPPGFAGELLTAKAFDLHYRLLPLLQKRVEVETLTLDTPVITLAQNATGDWNYDQLGGKSAGGPKPAAAAPAKPTGRGGLEISLSRVEMKHASVVMVDGKNKELLRINDANFSSSVDLSGDKLTGSGKASVELVTAAKSLFIHNFGAPVTITPEAVKLAPLSGRLADGEIGGDAALALAGVAKYTVNLQVKNADVVKLLQEAGVTKRVMSGGKLQLTTALAGTGGLATMNGSGKAEIVGGQLVEMPVLSLLATVLQVPALRDLKFDECRLEFSLSNNVMQTPVISLKSPQVQITGQGSVRLEDYALNHTFTLALARGALDGAPKEVQAIFTPRQDGFQTIDFKVWGPYDSPKTDIKERLIKGAAGQLIQKGLQQLFK
jgi:uncharacterized protein YhdP